MSHAAAISRVLRANPHFAPALGSGVMMVKQFGRECAVLSMQTNPLLVQARQFLEATYGVGQVRSLSGGVAGFTVYSRKTAGGSSNTPAPASKNGTPKPRALRGFVAWLDTFVEEKGVDTDHIFTVQGKRWGDNIIPLSVVLEAAKTTSPEEQAKIQKTLREIDFRNGDVMHYFEHLAKALAHHHG